jgi:hypothetical protein
MSNTSKFLQAAAYLNSRTAKAMYKKAPNLRPHTSRRAHTHITQSNNRTRHFIREKKPLIYHIPYTITPEKGHNKHRPYSPSITKPLLKLKTGKRCRDAASASERRNHTCGQRTHQEEALETSQEKAPTPLPPYQLT